MKTVFFIKKATPAIVKIIKREDSLNKALMKRIFCEGKVKIRLGASNSRVTKRPENWSQE